MNQKGFTNLILVLVIVVIAGAVGYFALMRKSTLPVQQTPTPTTSQVPATQQPTSINPTPSNAITNLKTYRNEKYGFEFQYPFNWSIRTDGVNDLALLRPGMSFPDKKNLPAHDGTYWGDIVIDIHSNSENSTVAKYLEQSNMWNPFAENLQYKKFTVSGSEIFKFSHIPGFFTSSFAYVNGPKLVVEITDIDVDDEFGDKILDQILSTFRFTR